MAKLGLFLLGFIFSSSLPLFIMALFIMIPGNVFLVMAAVILTPLVLFVFPLLLIIKCWRKKRAFSIGMMTGIIVDILFVVVTWRVGLQLHTALQNKM